jgi:Holliday junction DNA helicase RuvB
MFKQFLKVDDRGLNKTDIKILLQLAKQSDPVGLDMLATIANEDRGTVERSIEPYLLHEGLLIRTKRGRVLTDEGRRYLVESGYLKEEIQLGRAGRLLGVPSQ